MTTVMAIDPGATSGIAVRGPTTGGEVRTFLTFTDDELIEFILSVEPDVIVYERFATSARISKWGLQTVELGGVIRGIVAAWHKQGRKCKLVRHTPSMRKAWQHIADKAVRDDKAAGSRVVHQKDALAHLLCYEHTGR